MKGAQLLEPFASIELKSVTLPTRIIATAP
jgi:hypothetical protein